MFYCIQSIKRMSNCFQKALLKGIDFNQEPIFKSIFEAKYLNDLVLMQTKNKFIAKDSCILLGVIDPSGNLKKGEIFL